jgi:hypothetical protein
LGASVPGEYEYLVTDDLAIIITEIPPDGFMLSSVLGPFSKEKEDPFFIIYERRKSFLQRNGANVGLDCEEKLLTLSRSVGI